MKLSLRVLAAIAVIAVAAIIFVSVIGAGGRPIDLATTGNDPGLTIYGRHSKSGGPEADFFGSGVIHGHFNDQPTCDPNCHHPPNTPEDLVITAPQADGPWDGVCPPRTPTNPNDRCNAGEAYVILGSSNYGTDQTRDVIDTKKGQQSYTIYGPAWAYLGQDFSTQSHGGDINGDGFDDIILGSAVNIVYVILGSATLGVEDPQSPTPGPCGDGIDNGGDGLTDANDPDCYRDLAVTPADFIITGKTGDGGLGQGLAVRDVNGDPYADIIVGAPGNDGPGLLYNRGAVYVIFGSSNIGDTIHSRLLDDPATPPDVSIYGAAAWDAMPHSIDVRNVDGQTGSDINDIVIGAPLVDRNTKADVGAVYLISGRTSWPSTIDLGLGSQNYTIYGEDPGDKLGWAIYTGDVNGNGYMDILAGSVGEDGPGTTTITCPDGYVTKGEVNSGQPSRCNAGGARLIYGSQSLSGILDLATSSPNLTIYGWTANAANNVGAVHMGKLDKDPYEDIIIGQNLGGGTNLGKTFVIRGSATPLSGTRDLATPSSYDYVVLGASDTKAPGGYSGWWPIAADFNGDAVAPNGPAELITSAVFADKPKTWDPTQQNCATPPDGDPWCNVGAVYVVIDSDADGFPNGIELWVGTSISLRCATDINPNNETDDKWPPDLNDDRTVNVTDVTIMTSKYSPPEGTATYERRYDLNGDGSVGAADLNILTSLYGKSCTP